MTSKARNDSSCVSFPNKILDTGFLAFDVIDSKFRGEYPEAVTLNWTRILKRVAMITSMLEITKGVPARIPTLPRRGCFFDRGVLTTMTRVLQCTKLYRNGASSTRVKLPGSRRDNITTVTKSSVLINSPERKLTSAVAASVLLAFNGRTSREQSRKFQRGSDSDGDGDRFRIVGKADLSSGVAKPGLASNYSTVPSRCRRSFGRTEIRQVNQRSLRSPRAFSLLFPFRRRVFSASFARILEYSPGRTPAILLETYRKFICKFPSKPDEREEVGM